MSKEEIVQKFKAKGTLGNAVKANCIDCIYDPLSPGSYLKQTTNCTVTLCALHPYRPLDKSAKDKLKQARIAAMSVEERGVYERKREEARVRFSK